MPVGIDLAVSKDLPLNRIQDELEGVHTQLEANTREEVTLGCCTPILCYFLPIESIKVLVWFFFVSAQAFTFIKFSMAFFYVFNFLSFLLRELSGTDQTDRVSIALLWSRHPFNLEKVLMDHSSLSSASQSHIPQNHFPPVSDYSLAFALLCRGESPTLALSVLNEGLNSHLRPEFL